MIGGIIVITIDDLSILIKNNNLKLQSKDFPNSNSNMIYIDNKYLKKYNKVSDNIIKRISYKYSINEIEGGFTINRISHFN